MGGFVLLYNRIMATEVYKSETITLIDGSSLYLTPLKIRYLREFMDKFEIVKKTTNEEDTISALVDCALVTMQQYRPEIKTIDQLEDLVNLPNIYRILDVSASIKIDPKNQESNSTVKGQAVSSGETWDTMDLAKLESEAFLLGIWKDYEDLELSMSMPELVATLESKRELDYQEKKFLAAIQGVDLDAEAEDGPKEDPWEAMKARVFSGGAATSSNDVTSLQGPAAAKAGFGVGMGLDYVNLVKK